MTIYLTISFITMLIVVAYIFKLDYNDEYCPEPLDKLLFIILLNGIAAYIIFLHYY